MTRNRARVVALAVIPIILGFFAARSDSETLASRGIPASGRTAAASWTTATLPVNCTGWYGVSVQVDGQGAMHLTCTDTTAEGTLLQYVTNTGQDWSVETVASSSEDVGYRAKLQIGSGGDPFIAYAYRRSSRDPHELRIARHVAGSWQTETIAEVKMSTHMALSFALDSVGRASLAYFDERSDAVMYTRQTESGWVSDTVVAFQHRYFEDSYLSLALDSFGGPHIAMLQGDGYGSADLVHAVRTEAGWQTTTVDSAFRSDWVSIAIDSLDRPHIAYDYYKSPDRDGYIRLATQLGDTWSIDVAVKAQYNKPGGALELRNASTPHVAYYLTEGYPDWFYELYHAWLGPSEWHIERVPRPSRARPFIRAMSMDLDTTGRAHIVYVEGNYEDTDQRTLYAGRVEVPLTPTTAPTPSTLQGRIDAAAPDSTVWVEPGTYRECLRLRDRVAVKSTDGPEATVLNGGNRCTVVTASHLTQSAVLEGFTITRGKGRWNSAVYIERGGVTLRGNRFVDNRGPAIWMIGSFFESDPLIERNLFVGNETAIYANNSWANVVHNTIVGNGTGVDSMGFYSPSPTISNNILWGNGDDLAGLASATYSDVQDGDLGVGNISADPLFVNPGRGDYRLRPDSPCVDAGDPSSPLDPDGTRADMGAFPYLQPTPTPTNTAEPTATRPPTTTPTVTVTPTPTNTPLPTRPIYLPALHRP